MTGKVHVIVPDSHSHPDFDNRRYTMLGMLIHDLKPDTVIDIGDWFDMPSLCSYDRGKKSFEGRSYKRDIEAGLDAQDRMMHEIKKYKKKLPRFVRTLGNHENRVNRAVELDRVLEGTIGTNDFMSKEYGFEEYPFLETVDIDGIDYAHYFVTGVSGRPIGGEHPAYSLLTKRFKSSTCGHVHTFDYCIRTGGRDKLHGAVVGVYQDYHADYAGPANDIWNPGIVVKRGVENGAYDIEHISLKRIEEAYGQFVK
jgi:hypothetical protein